MSPAQVAAGEAYPGLQNLRWSGSGHSSPCHAFERPLNGHVGPTLGPSRPEQGEASRSDRHRKTLPTSDTVDRKVLAVGR
jgi:hypothetical protein